MEENKGGMLKSAMQKGLYFGGALVVINLLFYLLIDLKNWSLLGIAGFSFLVSFLPVILGLYVFTKSFRNEEMGGYLTYRQGLNYGMSLSFFSAVILSLYLLVFNSFIDPSYAHKNQELMKNKTYEFMTVMGSSQSQIDQVMGDLEKELDKATEVSRAQGALSNIVSTTFMGFIISLIMAAILKKEKPLFEDTSKQ